MPGEVPNVVTVAASLPNGDLKSENPSGAAKKFRESERRRRRRKEKKNKQNATAGDDSDTAAEDANGTADDSSKENSDPQKALEPVEIEYVPEKAELDGVLDDEFRKVFEKFNFLETATTDETDKKDDTATDVALKKDSDSEEEEQDNQQKEKGISNKKKKEMMGPEVERKRQYIGSTMEYTEDSDDSSDELVVTALRKTDVNMARGRDKAMNELVDSAIESGALDYSCFPPRWLYLGHAAHPILVCKGSKHYNVAIEIARLALDRIRNDPANDGKTLEFVCVDKLAMVLLSQYVLAFTVREVVADADAPLKTIQAWMYYPHSYYDSRDAEVVKWRWFHPSQGDNAAAL